MFWTTAHSNKESCIMKWLKVVTVPILSLTRYLDELHAEAEPHKRSRDSKDNFSTNERNTRGKLIAKNATKKISQIKECKFLCVAPKMHQI